RRFGEFGNSTWLTNLLTRCADARGLWLARPSAHRGGGYRRMLGPLARPITRLEPTRAPASPLACAPAAQPPPR
ncbi:MAG: hypothetical protein ACE5HB_08835, partial [Terriglobia bacterium]